MSNNVTSQGIRIQIFNFAIATIFYLRCRNFFTSDVLLSIVSADKDGNKAKFKVNSNCTCEAIFMVSLNFSLYIFYMPSNYELGI